MKVERVEWHSCAEEFDYMKNFAVLLAANLRSDPNAKVCLDNMDK